MSGEAVRAGRIIRQLSFGTTPRCRTAAGESSRRQSRAPAPRPRRERLRPARCGEPRVVTVRRVRRCAELATPFNLSVGLFFVVKNRVKNIGFERGKSLLDRPITTQRVSGGTGPGNGFSLTTPTIDLAQGISRESFRQPFLVSRFEVKARKRHFRAGPRRDHAKTE